MTGCDTHRHKVIHLVALESNKLVPGFFNVHVREIGRKDVPANGIAVASRMT
jgi:hypothetical protein